MDSAKDVMEYTDYLSFVGGEPFMIAKQIYDKIFSYALSSADSWEKSLIDDVLEEDGLLDKEYGISNDNSDDVADIALSLIDKGKIGTSVSRNLYSNLRKSTSKEAKKEAAKDTVSEAEKQVLKKEADKITKNTVKDTDKIVKNVASTSNYNTLTNAQKSRLNSLENTINDHLTEDDFKGTLRDLQGNPVPNGKRGIL